jgi:hypothetical protein
MEEKIASDCFARVFLGRISGFQNTDARRSAWIGHLRHQYRVDALFMRFSMMFFFKKASYFLSSCLVNLISTYPFFVVLYVVMRQIISR